jgi:hypothetical protein
LVAFSLTAPLDFSVYTIPVISSLDALEGVGALAQNVTSGTILRMNGWNKMDVSFVSLGV